MDQVVITCALTGVAANRKQCPAIPYTSQEIADEAVRAAEAGAAIVHIHARENDGSPSHRVEVYGEIMQKIRARSDIIINFSTGAVGIPKEERIRHITELKPEIGALNMGSMNYAKYSPKTKQFYFDFVFENSFATIEFFLNHMVKSGVRPEMECFDVGHIANSAPFMDQGLLTAPYEFSLILGVLGGIPATAENLAHMARQLPPGSRWQVIGISHQQWLLVAAALSLGGHIRVGLEDHFYLEDGVMARSNGELVAKAARMAHDIGRTPATPTEARRILGLSN